MLGGILSQNLKWTEHILLNQKFLIKQLGARLAILNKVSRLATFKTRKMIANGIFMSKLIYLIPLWGGCEEFLLRSLQVAQNKAARLVTKCEAYTSTKTCLKNVVG